MLEAGRNCWRIEQANRASLIVDAADYFHLARQAMLAAERQLLLIGWDFDTRIILDSEPGDDAPLELGAFLTWLSHHRPDLCIYILNWDLGTAKLLVRGSTIFRVGRWILSDDIAYRLDGVHPTGASHHQKIMVVDDRLAFCGGIDMTATRWDTREHLDKDKRRKRPTTGRQYGPWHDATMALDGDAARAIGELGRERWKTAGGEPIEPPQVDNDPWPEELTPQFQKIEVAIARTRGECSDVAEVREIEALYLDMIKRARRYIYFENQYFASKLIAEAIAKRIAEPDGPEVIVINPNCLEGWLEAEVMETARARCVQVLRDVDEKGRFQIYAPVTRGGEDIYVHSKIAIIDDEILRVGSANINSRSMGLDSECDVLIDACQPGNEGVREEIHTRLLDLLAEHLDVTPKALETEISARKSLVAAVEALRGSGRTLVPIRIEEPNAIEDKVSDALDPEPEPEIFEPMARRRFLSRLRRRHRAHA